MEGVKFRLRLVIYMIECRVALVPILVCPNFFWLSVLNISLITLEEQNSKLFRDSMNNDRNFSLPEKWVFPEKFYFDNIFLHFAVFVHKKILLKRKICFQRYFFTILTINVPLAIQNNSWDTNIFYFIAKFLSFCVFGCSKMIFVWLQVNVLNKNCLLFCFCELILS